jgi:hypothetical protein
VTPLAGISGLINNPVNNNSINTALITVIAGVIRVQDRAVKLDVDGECLVGKSQSHSLPKEQCSPRLA